MRKRFSIVIVVAILLSLFAPLTIAQDTPIILRYPITAEPEHLNPFTADTIAIGRVIRNIFEGLVSYNPLTDEYVPTLAESYTISEDKLTYTFKLRKGVLFHNIPGVQYEDREVKASDILWNYMTALSGDENISTKAGNLDSILGAAEYTAGEATEVPGLKMIDDYTFEITLAVPSRLFLLNGMVPITSPEAYEQLGETFANTPVGTGPFQFVEWRRQDHLDLAANPDYWAAGLPKVDGVRFINYGDANTALLDYRQNKLDFLFDFPTGQLKAVSEEFSDQFNEKPGLHLRYFGFKMSTGFLSENPLVRQAFNYALNRELIWDQLEQGARFPANLGMLPPSMPASTPATIYTYDPVKADQLLDDAGFPNENQDDPSSPRPGFPTVTLYVLSSLSSELSIPVWQEALRKLGVTLEIKVEEGATYWDHIVQDDVELFINGWAAGIPDPSDVFDFLILDGSGSMKYDNPEVNALLRAAQIEYDEEARTALYQQAHDIIMADSVVVPSAYSKVIWLQKPWIEGFEPGAGGTYTAPLHLVSVNADAMP
jgi:ABC-type transport system substrate-binding protein